MADVVTQRWTRRITVTDGGEEVIVLPTGRNPFLIAIVDSTGGVGTVHTSISSVPHVDADTAYWFEWPDGQQAAPYAPKALHDASAFKLLAIGGDVTFEILGVGG